MIERAANCNREGISQHSHRQGGGVTFFEEMLNESKPLRILRICYFANGWTQRKLQKSYEL
jgi:hypothetical protein